MLDLLEGDSMEIEIEKDAVDRLGDLSKITRKDWIDDLIGSPKLGLI